MKLWAETDVLRAESTDEFEQLLQKAQNRSEKTKEVAAKKTEQLMSELIALAQKLPIKRINDDKLRRDTIRSKCAFAEWKAAERGRYDYCDNDFEGADEATMRRWIVNYIRHNLVDYDEVLWQYKGRVGIVKSYPEFKIAVLQRIAEVYPAYADECQSQMERYKDITA